MFFIYILIARVSTPHINIFSHSLDLGLTSGLRYWIGLQIINGNITWIDGTPFSYNNLNSSSIISGSSQSVYFVPGKQWSAISSATELEGRICKKPSNPQIPAFQNGSALGYWHAHDPTILKTSDGKYIVYETNENIPGLISTDHITFSLNGTAFPNGLPWTQNWTQGQKCYWTGDKKVSDEQDCLWCPDTSYHDGKYWMYSFSR